MVKFKTSVLLISSLLIVAITAALTYLGLAAGGVIDAGKVEIVIQIDDNEKVYDGKPLYAESFKLISGELAETHEIVVTYTSSQINVGRSQALGTARVVNENLVDVSKDYDIKIKEGSLLVTQRSITVDVKDETKIYDGKPISASDIEITSGALVAGHVAHPNFTVVNENKNAGEYVCNLSASIVDGSGEDVSANYNITTDTGLLTINKAPLVIRSKSTEADFSSDIEVDFSYEVLSGSLVAGDYVSSVIFEDMNVSVGNNPIKISSVFVKDLSNNDVTDNYYIIVQNTGILTVNKYVLDLDVKDKEFEYDGQEKSSGDYLLDAEDESYLSANNFSVETSINVKKIDAGEYKNELNVRVYDSGKTDITEFFIINQTPGFLKINKAKINATFKKVNNDYKFEYDGNPHTLEVEFIKDSIDYTDQIDYQLKYAPVEQSDYFINTIPTDAGEYFVLLYSAAFKEDSEGFNNYEINIETDSYQSYFISPKIVSTRWDTNIKFEFNNETQHPKLTSLSILDGDEVDVDYKFFIQNDDEYIDSITSVNAGKYKVTSVLTGEDASNYVCDLEAANYEITAKDVELNWDLGEYVYNGLVQYPKLKKSADIYSYDDIDITYKIKDSKDSIKAGSYEVSAEITGAAAKNYNFDYNGTTQYIISKKEINLNIVDTYELKYTGDNYKVLASELATSNSLLSTHTLKLKDEFEVKTSDIVEIASMSPTASPKTLDIKVLIVDEAGNDVTNNYDVDNEKTINLKYSKQNLTFTGGYISKVYDGTPILLGVGADNEISIGSSKENLAEILYLDILISGVIPAGCKVLYDFDDEDYLESGLIGHYASDETADVMEIEFVPYIFTSAMENITSLFNITVNSGTQEILPKDLSISLGNYTKDYDGEEFNLDYVHPSIVGAINGDYNRILSDVIDSLAIKDDMDSSEIGVWTITGSYENANYSVSFNEGSITVNRAKIKVYTENYVMTYSARAFDKNVKVTIDDPTNNFDVEYSVDTDEFIDVGTYSLTPEPNGQVDETKYDVEVVSGTLNITPKPVVISIGSYVTEYNGNEYDGEITPSYPSDFPYDSSLMTIDLPTNVNTGKYKITGDYDDEDLENYEVTVIEGVLLITKRSATIKIGEYTTEYTGSVIDISVLSTPTFTGVLDDDKDNFNLIEEDYIDSGVYEVSATFDDPYNNYNMTIITGRLTITPKKMQIFLGDYSRTYNGDAFTYENDMEGSTELIIPDELIDVNPNGLTVNINVVNAGNYTITGTADYGNNYDVDVVSGSLTIVPITVMITMDPVRKFNGQALSDSDIKLNSNNALFDIADFEYEIECDNPDLDFDNLVSGVHVLNIVFDATEYYPNFYVIAAPGTLTVI